MGLNPEQLAAAATRAGFINVIAFPGTGKTAVFVARAIGILRDGTPPNKFLGLTFTRSAAETMEKRAKYTPGPGKPKIFRTFHGFALDFAKAEYQNFPFPVQHFPLLLPHEKYKVLGPLLKQMSHRKRYRDVETYISEMKRKDISPERAAAEAQGEFGLEFAIVYKRYEEKCKELGKFDFDSLLMQSVRLLESRPDILSRWQPDYLQCDEAQDNDTIQWQLIKLLGRNNVFVVGDPNQNMYSWRGAEPEGLTAGFINRFPSGRTLPLSLNYRSTQAIVDYLNEIMPVKTDGVLMRADPKNGIGKKPEFKRYTNENDEAEAILSGLLAPTETAVLARTNRQLAAFEKAAGRLDIKYKLLGKSGFFKQPEVEFTIAFAQYCAGAATDDTIKKILKSPYDACRFIHKDAAVESLERMRRGAVGNTTFARLLRDFESGDFEQNRHVRELRSRLEDTRRSVVGKGSQDALRTVITNFGILHHYEDDEDAIDNSPGDNVMSLLRMAEKKATLLDFVNLCHKAKQASRSTADRICFSTVHQAKGLEWKYVYVAGVNQDVLPHKDGDPEEEKKIYFVACSRAARELTVSCNEGASPFIKHKLSGFTEEQKEVDYLETMYANAMNGTIR